MCYAALIAGAFMPSFSYLSLNVGHHIPFFITYKKGRMIYHGLAKFMLQIAISYLSALHFG